MLIILTEATVSPLSRQRHTALEIIGAQFGPTVVFRHSDTMQLEFFVHQGDTKV